MNYFDKQQSWEFNFEGQFLGFATQGGSKLKYIRLELQEEIVCIKIPKYLRNQLIFVLKPGDRIQILGTGKLEPITGNLKLKADRVNPVIPKSEPTPPSKEVVPVKPKAKILVCQKSTCLKQGGKKLLQSLEIALSDRQLQDRVTIERTGCLKRCSSAPNFAIFPGRHYYSKVHPAVLAKLDEAIR